MKDNIAVGTMAGLVGGTAGIIFSYTVFLLGLSPMSSIHLAASLVVIDVLNLTTLGIIDAIFTHLLVASVFGILLTYILLSTGKSFWVLKGVGFGALFCLMTHAYLIPLMRTDEQVRILIFNPPSWTTLGLTHMLIGFVTVAVIVRIHDLLREPVPETLPDEKIQAKSYGLTPKPARKKVFIRKKI